MKWILFHSCQNGHLISARMKWSFHFGRNEMTISFWPKWEEWHFILAEMDISFQPGWNDVQFISVKIKWLFHFGRNEMTISFRLKWNDHFILDKMKLIPFLFGWNRLLILARIILLINMRPGRRQWGWCFMSSSADSKGGFELEKASQYISWTFPHDSF